MNEQEIIDTENRLMANVFAKKPLVITRGKGALVWDIKGKEYVDCMSGYGVALLGHCHPKIAEAVCQQVGKLITCHPGYYNDKRAEFLQKLTSITPKGLNKAFLSNSGAESIECAMKLARKHTGKPEIIAMMGAFHGKTMGALSATWDKKYREPFQPLVPEIKHVPPDNLEKVSEAISEKTAAVLVEPIRGEGGIRVPPDGFLKGLREICDDKNILLMFDEVQTGFGRTGKLFACEHWDVVPDVLCLAKPLAGFQGTPARLNTSADHRRNSCSLIHSLLRWVRSPSSVVAGAAAAHLDQVFLQRLHVAVAQRPRVAEQVNQFLCHRLQS